MTTGILELSIYKLVCLSVRSIVLFHRTAEEAISHEGLTQNLALFSDPEFGSSKGQARLSIVKSDSGFVRDTSVENQTVCENVVNDHRDQRQRNGLCGVDHGNRRPRHDGSGYSFLRSPFRLRSGGGDHVVR